MNYIKIMLILVFVFLLLKVSSQEIDTNNIIMNAKFNIINFNKGDRNKDFYIKFIDYKPNYKFLQSKGFFNIVFFQINTNYKDFIPNDYIYRINSSNDTFKLRNILWFYNYTFIFGYNKTNGDLYKLKGFEKNDFEKIFKIIDNNNLINDYNFFINNYWIEGLDMECLYKSLKYNKKNKLHCITPANEVYNGN